MTQLVKKASLGLLLVSLLGAPAFAGKSEKGSARPQAEQPTGEVSEAQCEQVSGATSKTVGATPAPTAETHQSQSKSGK